MDGATTRKTDFRAWLTPEALAAADPRGAEARAYLWIVRQALVVNRIQGVSSHG